MRERHVVPNPIKWFFDRGITGQREAWNKQHNLTVRGSILYSHNVPLVMTLKDEFGHWYLLNNTPTSVTTAGHQAAARSQTYHRDIRVCEASLSLFRALSERPNIAGNGPLFTALRRVFYARQEDEPYAFDAGLTLVDNVAPDALLRLQVTNDAFTDAFTIDDRAFLLVTRDETTLHPWQNRTLILLPSDAKPVNVAQAFLALEPEEILAERAVVEHSFRPFSPIRQGDLFFVPAVGSVPSRKRENELRQARSEENGTNWTSETIKRMRLRSPIDSPNAHEASHFATLVCRDYPGRVLVKGYVTHGNPGRYRPAEHSRLHFPTWHAVFKSRQFAAVTSNNSGAAGD